MAAEIMLWHLSFSREINGKKEEPLFRNLDTSKAAKEESKKQRLSALTPNPW